MSNITGIYALWYREVKVFLRERSRIVSSVINPIIWLVVFGGGLGASVQVPGTNYQAFIFPGMITMTLLFGSIFFGAYIVWDRKIDFLKEVLVAPISRTSVFFGKVLGGATDSLLQSMILLVLGMALTFSGTIPGLLFTPLSIASAIVIIFLSTASMVSLGLIIGSQMESPEGFQMISSFVVFPMFLLSGALFSISNLPAWFEPFTLLNPMTYSVDALRSVLVGVSRFPVLFNVGVLGAFTLGIITVGTYAFKKMKV